MAVNSKQKGNTFERHIAKTLTDIFGKEFFRTAHSGAYTGKSNADRKEKMGANIQKAFVGDIIVPEEYNLVIECKNYAGVQGGFNGMIQGSCKGLDTWLSQLLDDSDNGKVPHILFFKITSLGEYFVIPTYHFKRETIDDVIDGEHLSYLSYALDTQGGGLGRTEYLIISLKYLEYFKDCIEQVITNGK